MKIERVVKHFIHLNRVRPKKKQGKTKEGAREGCKRVSQKKKGVPAWARKHLVFFRLLKLPAMAFYDITLGESKGVEGGGRRLNAHVASIGFFKKPEIAIGRVSLAPKSTI